MNKCFINLFLFFLLIIEINLFAQVDKEFWFVAPEITPNHDAPGGRPIRFIVTNINPTIPATVKIEMPKNPLFTTITRVIAPGAPEIIDVSGPIAGDESILENKMDNIDGLVGKSNKGIHITSTAYITVYYEISSFSGNNSDLFSLKGKNALGSEFYTVFQNSMYNQPIATVAAYSAFDVVFTQDATDLYVDIPAGVAIYNGTPGGLTGSNVFIGKFNKGDTYHAAPVWLNNTEHVTSNTQRGIDLFGRAGKDHLSGVRVYTKDANKKIAITLKDDSMKSLVGGCYDIAGDQTIPIDIIGTEYIAMKGNLSSGTPAGTSPNFNYPNISYIQERVYIAGTKNGDSVFINGVFQKTLNKSQTVFIEITDPYIHIRTNYPSYVFQITGNGCEMGGAILPPIGKNGKDVCTGSTKVAFTRSLNGNFYINIMVRKGAENSFTINGAPFPAAWISSFTAVPGESEWLAARLGTFNTTAIPQNIPQVIENSKDVFHLGVIDANGGGTRYGYFSSFNEFKIEAINENLGSINYIGCIGDTVQLVASGGTNVYWKPSDYLSDPYSLTPKAIPPYSTNYVAYVSGMCNMKDSTNVSVEIYKYANAEFTVDKVVGCAPLEVNFYNKIERGTRRLMWKYTDTNIIDQEWIVDTTKAIDSTFSYLYRNTTNAPLNYELRLVTFDKTYSCKDTLRRNLVVYPEINADFSLPDTIGCHPFPVAYQNTSTGDTLDWEWTFGDGGWSFGSSPNHTFYNIGTADSVYKTTLIATNPEFCADTVDKNIVVHPYIDVNFIVDTGAACTPYPFIIKNQSYGVNNYRLKWGDGSADSLMNGFTQITRVYQNADTVLKNIFITLIGWNNQGCFDSITRRIIVKPSVTAFFNADTTQGCDSTLVTFTNQSQGHKLKYLWDFGDSTYAIARNTVHRYMNKTNDSIHRSISLVIESEYFCRDTHSIVYKSYPYLKADFAVDTAFGCHPFKAGISNKSIGASAYSYDFNDGSGTYSGSDAYFIHLYNNINYTSDTTYNITLNILNSYGCTDQKILPVTVYNNVRADFSVDASQKCYPAIFSFTNKSQGQSSTNWSFGDNATSVLNADVMHEYPINNTVNPISYTVHIEARNKNNACLSTKDTTVFVKSFIEARFESPKYVDCHPFKTTFTNSSKGIGANYSWYVDSVQESLATNFSTIFYNTAVGITRKYEVLLTASNSQGCSSSFLDTIAVYPEVVANFGAPSFNGCHPFIVSFADSSKNATNWQWDYSDGASSSLQNPVYTFNYHDPTGFKTFNVRQIVGSNNCYDTINKIITVRPLPNSSFEVDKTSGCAPHTIRISNGASIEFGTKYSFTYDDGTSKEDYTNKTDVYLNPHTFFNPTFNVLNFYVKQVVDNGVCQDTTTRTISVLPMVRAYFKLSDSIGCDPLTVNLTNQSQGYQLKYLWEFGDFESSTQQNVQHIYKNDGFNNITYATKLKAVSSYGCIDDTTLNVTVYPSPQALFVARENLQFYPDTVIDLENNTPDGPWSYLWSFDDGATSTQRYPGNHNYLGWGDFNIKLAVYGPNCSDSATQMVSIKPPRPIAKFSNSDNGCVPLTVYFTNESTFGTNYYWDFNNGDISKDKNPIYIFETAGEYLVSLVVEGDGGRTLPVYSEPINVYQSPIINFTVSPDLVQLPDQTIKLTNNTKFASKYLWDFGDSTYSEEKNPEHLYPGPPDVFRDITLYAWSPEGCKDSMVKQAAVYVEGKGVVDYPNIFIPSKSGSNGGEYSNLLPQDNTIFRPYSDGVTAYRLEIYNRWGELLYISTDVNKGWDGYYKSKLCDQGVYIWKVEGTYSNGKPFTKIGDVTILIQ